MRAISVKINESAVSFLCKTSKPGVKFSVKGVPEDAKLVHCYYDSFHRALYAIFEHDSFCEVSEGCPYPPASRIEYTQHYEKT